MQGPDLDACEHGPLVASACKGSRHTLHLLSVPSTMPSALLLRQLTPPVKMAKLRHHKELPLPCQGRDCPQPLSLGGSRRSPATSPAM